MSVDPHETEIAVVGLACRLPGARDVEEFRANLRAGVESVSFFGHDELRAAGVAERDLRDPAFVPAYGAVPDAWAFDAEFFGVNPREAEVMDPQQRVFLECAWTALEDAGVDPARYPGPIAVYAGAGKGLHLARVMANPDVVAAVGSEVAHFANERDFLTTRVSYKLGLRGPSVAVQTACSTSLVAIHLAVQSLLAHECSLALAGGVTIHPDQEQGYRYEEGGILSPDGHCRAFDARAAGTVGGSGAGIVVLKRMADALRDGDPIHAVLRGSAINNDGAGKIGFTAPSVKGQAHAIAEALAVAGVEPGDVGFVETHGTGTRLGDPIEIAALAEVFRGVAPGSCALGAVKTNLGHVDAAAGVAGFIKAVLALKHGEVPPTLHFQQANPETGLDGSPFFVTPELREWKTEGRPRIAGVSSFGMGGTNAHVVLQEPPDSGDREQGTGDRENGAAELVVLSARSAGALERMRGNLARHLAAHPGLPLADVAFTLREHRAAHAHRWAVAARDAGELRRALEGAPERRPSARVAAEQAPPVAFLFPGQGTQHAEMGRELYEADPVFRAELDRCAELLQAELGMDLRAVLFPAPGGEEEANAALRQTRLAQPALFAVEHALARTWMHRGVQPESMLGHSIGEYVAACLAGVFTLEAALRLVAARGRLMQELPAGAMLAVPLPEAEVRAVLSPRLSLAAVNGAAHCVLSGGAAEVDEAEAALSGRGVSARRLHTSHAFHSAAMDPILGAFAAEVRKARPAAPSIPFLSNVTGRWITAAEATDAGYWVRHLRETVRFGDGAGRLLEDPSRVLLEVGPGEALGTFARRHPGADPDRVIVASLPRPDRPDDAALTLLDAAGALWTAGVPVDWRALRGGSPRRRVWLPTYPFERTVYRVPRAEAAAPAPPVSIAPRTEPMPQTAAAEPSPARRSRAAERVTGLVAGLLGADPARLDPERTLLDLGADSLLLMQASRTLESSLGVRIPFRRLMEDLSTLRALAEHLERELPELAAPEPEPEPEPEIVAEPRPVAAAPSIAVPAIAAAAEGDGGDATLRDIVARQLDLMQAQIELLRGGASPASAAALGSNGKNGNGIAAQHPPAAVPSSTRLAGAASAPDAREPQRTHALTHSRTAVGAVPAHGPHRPVSATIGLGGAHDERQARYFAAFLERYTARTRRSKEYAAANRPALADNRAALNFRLATKELLYPIVGERSHGSRLWDVDGNEYVDFTLGFGVHFFGHRPEFILSAVQEQLERGLHLGPQSDLAGPVAALFRELTGMERAAFCNTGSEAVMTALRIVRAVTGRAKVVIFEGSYHGCFDGILAGRDPSSPVDEPRSRPVAPGTVQGMVDDVVVLPYGTGETLGWLRANAATLAAVLVEPVQSRNPEFHPVEFLRELRVLTERAGAALVFDEMITGLRLQARGAQGLYGVDADLATYGKVIGGGFPLGVVAGRARWMDAIDGGQWSFGDDSYPAADQTFFAGTFCKHPVTMAAARAVLLHLQARGPALYEELNARTARLVARLRQLLRDEDVPISVVSCASLFQFRFPPRDPVVDLLFYHMIERGIYIWEGRACFVSTAHTDEDCDRLVDALRDSIHALRRGGFFPGGPSSGGGDGDEDRDGDRDPDAGPAASIPVDLRIFPSPDAPPADDAPRSFALTPAQRAVWTHARLGDDASRAYNSPLVFGVRGRVDADALRAALADVAAHHEALRTVFDDSGDSQRVLDAVDIPLLVTGDGEGEMDDATLAAALEAAVRPAFDLAAGPLMRVQLVRRAPDLSVVQLVVHHLAADALGAAVLLRDLDTAYRARLAGRAPDLPPAMQFREYARLLEGHAAGHAAREEAWLERFRGASPLALPYDRPRAAVSSQRGARQALEIAPALAGALREASRREGCTLFMTLLAGVLAVLHRAGGGADVLVGIPSAGRPFPGSAELVGHCVDVLPVRSRIAGGERVRDFLRSVRALLLDAYEDEVFSFSRLQERLRTPRGPGVPPLVSLVFNLEPGGGEEERSFGGMEMVAVAAPALSTTFDLDVDAVERGAAIELACTYNADLFDPETVAAMLRRLVRVLEQIAAGASVPLSALEVMDAEERRLLETWNATDADGPAEPFVHHRFEAHAARAPGAVAVEAAGETLTYAELDARAGRLARRLAALGVGPETRVGLCLERGVEMVVAVLAVLKSGGAWVPLDPEYPAARLAFMLADSGAALLLTHQRLRGAIDVPASVAVLALDAEEEGDDLSAEDLPSVALRPEGLAYVIYTSGSTGTPKGVAVEHRALSAYVHQAAREYALGAGDRFLQFTSISFDPAVEEILATLATGATLVVRDAEAMASPEAFWAACRRRAITLLGLPTAVWAQMAAHLAAHPSDLPPSLRVAVIGGERAPAEAVRAWKSAAPSVRLLNSYGPTETTIGVTLWDASAAPAPEPGAAVPIGAPVAGTRAYVLDEEMNPVPIGVPGELFVGGAQVARGYLHRPALTAGRFVPDPFSPAPGARLYRTGDRARLRWVDGDRGCMLTLEFLGRLDEQVKVRGFRVEPGEVEAALRAVPGVADCAVAAREDRPGDARLVAWIAGDAEVDAVRAALRRTLPEHLVPSAFVRMDAIPLAPNGKVDRRALPAPDASSPADRYVAPRTPAQAVLAEIWAAVLGVERVGAEDGFFELGGHSLLATRVASRVREAFGVELPVRALFDAPTVAALAERIEELRRDEGASPLPPVVPVERAGPVAASFAQERLWFLERLQPGGAFYNIPIALRLRGELHVPALERALGELVRRHESLRTTLAERDGAPVQVIAPFAGFRLPLDDLCTLDAAEREAELHRRATDDALRPFDLEAGPLFRAALLRLGGGEHALLVCLHHAVGDGESIGVLFRELAALYGAFRDGRPSPLPEPALQYADWAAWQRARLAGDALERPLRWWRERLAGAPPLLELPTDRPRPAARTPVGAAERFELPAELLERLQALGRRHGASLYMVLLGAFQVLLSRWAGSDDVPVGSPVAGRTGAEAAEMVGLFVNTLVLRGDFSGDPSFAEVLRRVRETALGAWEHQDVPFERLVEELQPRRSLSHSPLFQVMFRLDGSAAAPALPGLRTDEVETGLASGKFDLSLAVAPHEGGLSGALSYAADLFDADTIRRMVDHLARVLEQVAARPELRVSRIELLDDEERRRVVHEWNRTGAPYPHDRCIHQLVEEQARRTPDAVALAQDGRALTYAEMDAAANRMAHRLLALGVRPEERVALCLEQGIGALVGLLAALKAGAAYLPVDSAAPDERIAFILDESAVRVVLTTRDLAGRPWAAARTVVDVDDAAALATYPSTAPERETTPVHLAYVLYTSGSTGRPKGVGVQHGSVCNVVSALAARYEIGPGDRMLLLAPLHFDSSVAEIFSTLVSGAALHLPRGEAAIPGPEQVRLLADAEITHAKLTPSALAALPHADLPALRVVAAGGEACPAELVDRWAPGRRFLHFYGPTEATVRVTAHECRAGGGTPPLGRPLPNARLYVVDAGLRPLPAGLPGELAIGGVPVTRGYLGRPALTAERFVPDPFSGEPGRRLYRTGDRARWRRDGLMEFLGRIDGQVKVRGFRIETGEIEAALLRHPGVAACAVVVREDDPGDRRLAAYVVGPADGGGLREHLRAWLPEYMVPAAFVPLDALPLGPTGKLDRRALPAPGYAAAGADAPRTPVEEVLAAAWAQVLGMDSVGVHDGFFELGGHSLLATRLVSRIRELLGVELPLRDLFEAPTVAAAAERVAALGAGIPPAPPVVPVERTGEVPLSFAQERLWFIDRMEGGSAFYNIPTALRLRGTLDAAALERALGEIVRRHEALRTVFAGDGDAPVQRILPFDGCHLPIDDLSALSADGREAEVRRRADEDAALPFDLGAGPVFRARLLRLGEQEHVLLLCLHHVAGDGWSMGVLFAELSALYAAFRDGRPSPLPDLPVQYADFAVWQRERLRGEVLERQLAWWKERLAGAPAVLELPADRPRPPERSYRGARVAVDFPPELTERLRALGRREGATLFMVLLGAFQALLARDTGSEDVVVGSPVAGRTRAETEGLIGFFVNSLVLRGDLSDDPEFREVLRRVRLGALGAYEHQELPFERLVAELAPERGLDRSPLFQVVFALQEGAGGELDLPGLHAARVEDEVRTAHFDLTLNLATHEGGIAGVLDYATDLFDRATVERMLARYRRLLEQVADDAGVRLSRIELLGDEERRLLLEELNRAGDGDAPAATVHALFEEQAAARPDAVAVSEDAGPVTYAELNARANRIARRLMEMGVGMEDRVAVSLHRGAEMLAALLAVLKAGAAYVPLDPAYPAARLRWMLADCGARVLVTDDALGGALPDAPGVRILALGGDDVLASEDAANPDAAAGPGSLAYVMYTSGSTGTPRGVAVEHRAVVRLVRGAGYVAFGPGEAVLQAAPASFDASTLEIWGALLNGGRVVPLAAAAPSLAEIGGAVARHGVTTMWLTAGLFQLMARERLDDLAGVRQLLAGGDVLPPDAVRAVRERFPAMRLVNGYGPTENTTFTCCHTVGAEWDGGPVPIGTPISGTRAYVLDAALRPVPLGVAGELYAGGLGVARGYLHRPALTAGRFLPDPFSATPGARMYRTGDRVRWVEEVRKYGSTEVRQGYGADEASSGAGPIVLSYSRTFVLHFLGRLDTQVKIRGFRIEPGEVEAALLAHPRVSACAVAARPDPAGGRRLVAWVAGGADAGELREHLRASLPEHMVPAAFVMVEALPLTPNGKVDRSALPEPDAAATSDRLHAPPETAAEEALAAIWAEVLGVERVGRGDSFFELGGHSLLVMRLLNHLHAELGVELSIRTVFSHHTLAAMASEVERTLYAELAALPDDEVERLAGLTATGGPR